MAAEKNPQGKKEPSGIFRQLGADEDLPCPAAAIEIHGAKGQRELVLYGQSAMQDRGGKGEKHHRHDERGATNGGVEQEKQAATNFQPRQEGGDGIQRER